MMAEQLSQLLRGFSKGKTLSVVLVFLLSLLGFGVLIFWNSQPDYQVLFSNLSPEDGGEMVSKLREKKIPFQLTHGGTTLLVSRDQVYDLRLTMAAEGLPKGGGVGFEVFDRTNLGITDFVQKLNYQRALQGELSRTIRQIKEIEQVRVHIVTPKDSLFIEDQKKPTASVFVRPRSGMTLGASQVEGVVHLVASAVEGLEPGNVTVVDTSGKILSKRSENSLIGQLTTTQLEFQRNIEENLKRKAQGMLEEVLGPNKAIARVSAEVDFQQVDITEERYDPTTILRSEQKNTERSMSTSGSMATGESRRQNPADPRSPKPGAGVNPESAPRSPVAPSLPGNANSSERQHEIRNYEISRINKHIKNPVGQVKKVSAAVIVDGTYKEGTGEKGNKEKQYAPRSQEEMKNLENLVKKAIGYSEERGDQVEVTSLPFYWSTVEEDSKTEKKSIPWQDYLMMIYKPAVSLILALLFLLFVVRPLLKGRSFGPGREEALLQPARSGVIPSSPLQELPQEMRPSVPLNLKDQTVKLVQKDPSKTVGIVKSWLNERE
jgi:flagellar M-ring protein FliF